MSFTTAVDPTYGLFIQTVTANGVTWSFDPQYFFAARVYANPPGTEADIGIANFSAPALAGPVNGLYTITYDAIAPLTGLQFKFYVQEEVDGTLSYRAPEVSACPAGLSVVHIRFPHVSPLNYGTGAQSWGVLGGAVIPEPHTQTDVSGALNILPPSLLFSGIYDAQSKNCLMLWCDDEENNGISAKLTGLTASTLLYYQHHMDRRYQLTKTYAKTYEVHLEPFTGISPDGRLCYQDFCDRYRDWFASGSRPWGTRGHWYNAASVSSKVKTKALVFNNGTGSTAIAAEATSLAAYIGASKLLVRWRFEDGSFQDHPPYPGLSALTLDYLDGITTLRTASIDVSIYTLEAFWLAAQGSPYDPDSYSGFGDLKPMMLHDSAGTARQNALDAYMWDYTHASTDNVLLEVIAGYYTLHSGEKPTGIYLDAFTVYYDAMVGLAQEDLAADTGWTFTLQRAGLKAALQAIRTARRAAVAETIIHAEVVDTATVDVLDLCGIWKPWHTYEAGNDVRSQSYIAGELIRTCKLDGIGVAEGNEPYIYATNQAITKDWLATGIATVSDLTAANTLVNTSNPATGTFGMLWQWVKKLVDFATGPAADYFHGKRVLGFGDDYTFTLNASSFAGTFEEARVAALCGPYPVQTAVWQAQDGSVAVVVCHCYKAGMSSPVLACAPGPRWVDIRLVPEAYGLNPAVPLALVRTVDGVQTLVTRWTPTSTLVAPVQVEEFTVNLFELVVVDEDLTFDVPNMSALRARRSRKTEPESVG